ncbi:beta-ketoacyl synthase N-terminal-like domain-containing protein [Solwaraspora sp. WMMD406]|uniref:beta-ketoacyl synthase N-terminal-like domain-containing protein n=1 Tax=Solwaraspora sp. WMMD406 TaxID=3016095 RepID=UPI0024168630|nr:beta-ketoacyl synthase N-terminal-like domain-containing protein [Solwaraspora sp. WMMD406]MDG4763527.1 beta-ketoacyl synthase N-terminal-like domain-containing protein [Solwaraspora sp. WMMD406]
MTLRQSVITGMGVIAPSGVGVDDFWRSALENRGVLGRLTRYPTQGYPLSVAGEVRDYDPAEAVDSRIRVQTDRFTQFALAAAGLALDQAQLRPETLPPYSFGAVTASAAGGVEFGQREIERLWSRGPGHVGPYQSIAWFYAASTGQLSIRYGLKGPCGVLVADESGGLDAIAHAARDIRYGATAMLAGGAEAPFAPFSMACQYGHGMLSEAHHPDAAYLPFSPHACGFVPAEGGAMLVLEEERAARARAAEPLVRVAGHGTTYSGVLRHGRSADGLARAILGALDDAECSPRDISAIFADGLAVPAADRAEVAALRQVFGAALDSTPVTVPKTGFGRAYAGAAALDVVLAALALRDGVVPPTPYVTATVLDIDLVTGSPRPIEKGAVLVLARGISGGNSALILRTVPRS